MEKLKTLLNNIFPFEDFLYILQLEEYKSLRYLKSLKKFYFQRDLQQHDTLKNTKHIKTLRLLAQTIYILPLSLMWIKITLYNPQVNPIVIGFIVTGIITINIPLLILLANILTQPAYYIISHQNITKAKNKVNNHKNLYIIGITGSFGKTTTKNFIYQLIQYNYRTQMIPGNINTTIGIANWIQKHLKTNTEILIVEMGAYVKGEIKKSCEITPPDIAIITALADQHLERFGSFEKLIKAKLEIFQNSKKDSIKLIPGKYYSLLPDKEKLGIKTVEFNPQRKLSYRNSKIETNLNSKTAIKNLNIALKVAEILEIQTNFIKDSAQKLNLPPRRKQIILKQGFEVIDDSYNISFTTAKNGIEEGLKIAKQKNKKLVIITGGIPELGMDTAIKNRQYGKFLEEKTLNIVLLNTEFAPFIKEGLTQIEDLKEIIEVNSMQQAFERIKQKYNPDTHLILIQPELTDLNY